jgi:hypothetical protein
MERRLSLIPLYQASSTDTLRGMRALIGAVALLTALAGCGDTSGVEKEVDAKIERDDATRVCKDFVKDRLKSPASAEFDTDVKGKAGVYTVVGTVDSENSFGAMMRNEFSCKVKLDGDTWRLRKLTGITN